jgi:hypothetical protein
VKMRLFYCFCSVNACRMTQVINDESNWIDAMTVLRECLFVTDLHFHACLFSRVNRFASTIENPSRRVDIMKDKNHTQLLPEEARPTGLVFCSQFDFDRNEQFLTSVLFGNSISETVTSITREFLLVFFHTEERKNSIFMIDDS